MSSNGAVPESKTDAAPAAKADKPKKLKRVERPNKDAHVAKIERMHAGIKTATEKRDGMKKKLEDLKVAVRAAQAEVKAGRDTMASLKDERSKVNGEVSEIRAQLSALRGPPRGSGAGAGAGGRRDGGKRAVHFRSLEEADRAIDELEYRQKSEALSLADEKLLIKQLGEYRAARSAVSAAAAGREAASRAREASEETRTSLKERIDSKKKELDSIHARMSAQHEILQGLNAKVEAARAKFLPLNKEKDDLWADIDSRWVDLKAAKAAFSKANLEWKNFKDAERKQRDEEKRLEREQFLAKVDAEAAEAAAEPQEEVKPWLEELRICDLMTTYVTKLKPRDHSASATSSPADSPVATSGELAGLKGGRKGFRADDLDLFAGTKKKKAGRRRTQGAKKKNIPHNIETLGYFRTIGVDAPRTLDSIDDCIKQLAEKKAYYETAPAPPKPEPKSKGRKGRGGAAGAGAGAGAGASAPTESVTTPYGPATVVSRRSTGQVVVRMTGFAATAYLQPDQVTSK